MVVARRGPQLTHDVEPARPASRAGHRRQVASCPTMAVGDETSWDGRFWLADTPDASVPGRLDLSGRWPTVTLHAPLTQQMMLTDRHRAPDGSVSVVQTPTPLGPEAERHLVHGELNSPPDEVTLVDCFTTNRAAGQRLQAAYALLGGHVTAEVRIGQARTRLRHLDRWAGLNGLHTLPSPNLTHAQVTFTRPESPTLAVPEHNLRLTIEAAVAVRESSLPRLASLEQVTWLRLDDLPSVHLRASDKITSVGLRRVVGSHRVVPVWVEVVAGDGEGVDGLSGVFDAGWVLAGV